MLSYTQTGTSSLCPGLDLHMNTVFYIHTCCKLPPPALRLAHIQPLLAGLPPYRGLRSQLICGVHFSFPLSFLCSVLLGRESLYVSYHPTITLESDASILLMNTVWHSFFLFFTPTQDLLWKAMFFSQRWKRSFSRSDSSVRWRFGNDRPLKSAADF